MKIVQFKIILENLSFWNWVNILRHYLKSTVLQVKTVKANNNIVITVGSIYWVSTVCQSSSQNHATIPPHVPPQCNSALNNHEIM